MEDSPYILENYIKNLQANESVMVKHTILTTCVKLFIKRPPELQKTLGLYFSLILSNESEDLDIKDRAAFYYRAMQANIQDFVKSFK